MASYIQVQVTQDDIDKADPKKSGRCVVARALARTIPDARRIEIDVQSVRYTRDGERYVYFTPYPVTGYIVAFDAGDEIHPFTFRLNEAQRIGVKRQPRTEAGKRVTAAKTKVRDRKQKAAKVVAAAADPSNPSPPKPAEVQLAHEKVTEAEAELETVQTETAGKPVTTTDTTHGVRRAPQRSVWKTGRREYGMRKMSINGGREDRWTGAMGDAPSDH